MDDDLSKDSESRSSKKRPSTTSQNSNNIEEKVRIEVKLDLDDWTVPIDTIEKHSLNLKEAELEKDLRMLGCDIIQISGIRLKLPQVAMSTAQMLFQRVYYSNDYTFTKEPVDISAMAALFLAAKIEEHPKRSKDIINAFVYVLSKKLRKDFNITDNHYVNIKKKLDEAERKILKNLGFCVRSSNPHKVIVTYHRAILNAVDKDENVWKRHTNQAITQRAWNYCNDSLRTDVFVRHPKEVVACACIQMASNDMKSPFPKTSDNRSWYSIFNNISDDQIEQVCRTIEQLYTKPFPDVNKLSKHFGINPIIADSSGHLPRNSQQEKLQAVIKKITTR